MKQDQKFQTEFAFLQASCNAGIIKPSELYRLDEMVEEQKELLNQAHIYFVCQRPRIRLAKSSHNVNSNFKLEFKISNQHNEIDKTVNISDAPDYLIEINSEKNGSYFRFKRVDGTETCEIPLEMLLKIAPHQLTELSDLEVIYIGQAIGNKNERSAIDRLLSHSTLQKYLLNNLKQLGGWKQ